MDASRLHWLDCSRLSAVGDRHFSYGHESCEESDLQEPPAYLVAKIAQSPLSLSLSDVNLNLERALVCV